ncbi:MAG: GIDE domain-containing protein [Polyangiaceae bacterium]
MVFTVGMVAVCLGIIGIIWGIFNKIRAGRVVDAPFVKTGEVASKGAAVASPKGAISAEGNVACPQPLIAPVSGVPCLWYSLKCTATWKAGDVTKHEDLDSQKMGTRFTIDDGSGPVVVDTTEGGDFEPTKKSKQSKAATLMGGLTNQTVQIGNYVVNPKLCVGMGWTYEVEEEYMPVESFLFACGVVGTQNSIAAPKWRQLMLTNINREKLLGGAQKTAKLSLAAGAASFVLGSAIAVVAQVFLPNDTAEGKAAISAQNAAAATAPAKAAAPPPKKK